MRILMVEDEPLVRETVVEELRECGFEVIEAETGEEAVARCSEQMADVLFTDIRLPGAIDGWAIAEHCRRANPAIPVIYATGYSGGVTRMVPRAVLFSKPYRTAQIVNAIRQLARAC
jgi:CheY-like chemotaxis protein